jgi:hypothetical protein
MEAIDLVHAINIKQLSDTLWVGLHESSANVELSRIES